jgi:50S ribosomal subunit-associated GTPase HflX
MNETYLKSKISAKISEKINRNKVTSVLFKDDLTTEQAFNLEKLNLS